MTSVVDTASLYDKLPSLPPVLYIILTFSLRLHNPRQSVQCCYMTYESNSAVQSVQCYMTHESNSAVQLVQCYMTHESNSAVQSVQCYMTHESNSAVQSV
jgi:hypothetical protein